MDETQKYRVSAKGHVVEKISFYLLLGEDVLVSFLCPPCPWE